MLDVGCWALRQGRLSDEDLPKVLILLASFGDDVTEHTLKRMIQTGHSYQTIMENFLTKIFLGDNHPGEGSSGRRITWSMPSRDHSDISISDSPNRPFSYKLDGSMIPS